MPADTMTLEEVCALKSGDCSGAMGVDCTIAESGPVLEEFYETNPRWNYGNQTGKFWEKVGEVVNILKTSNDWPFEALEVNGDKTYLFDGHHRANAAILANWDKPIPVQTW
ncbi:ParB-like nuclease domain protein [Mycobacterium phage Charm]|nr:ParB-like nuclease domain protein [Mycobacterium phage Charm]QGJ88358.1 ParB-like nuclease domain protein [Mycobacterium phage DreamTeam1]